MLEALITSKTRIKILLKFFVKEHNHSYLRGLEQEFNESSNSIRLELNRFEKACLLKSYFKGNKKYYYANTQHPFYNDIYNMVQKVLATNQMPSSGLINI